LPKEQKDLMRQAGFVPEGKGPLMICEWVGTEDSNIHFNLGEYEGDLRADAVRTRLFEIVGKRLQLTGMPTKLGTLADAKGHPETGVALENPAALERLKAVSISSNRKPTHAGCFFAILCVLVLLAGFAHRWS
jgi:hypothetical protein